MTNKPKFKVNKFKNYLSMIDNSVGSALFANLWVTHEDGRDEDVAKEGDLSCATYVSGILKLNDMIAEMTATVDKLIVRMMRQGWTEVKVTKIKPGDVIVWNKRTDDKGEEHRHIGFYVGDKKAVSNSPKLKKIVRHGWDYGGRREIVKILRWNGWSDK